RFVPVSRLNQLRRDLTTALEEAGQRRREESVRRVQDEVCPPAISKGKPTRTGFGWSIKVDRVSYVDAFEKADWQDINEVIVDIARDSAGVLLERLEQLSELVGRDRLRLALPALTRKWEEDPIVRKIEALRQA